MDVYYLTGILIAILNCDIVIFRDVYVSNYQETSQGILLHPYW